MQRFTMALFCLLTLSSQALCQDPPKTPKDIQRQMEKMVGSWKFEGEQGARSFSGEETIRFVNNKMAVLQEGYFNKPGGEKEHYVILSGWDGSTNSVLVRGFTSDGFSWDGKWHEVKAGKWIGTVSGGPASFEVKQDSMRYEDDGDGVPWVSRFERVKKEPETK